MVKSSLAQRSQQSTTDLSGVERYFCFWNFFSRPSSCSSVKMVRLRRGLFSRGVLCSVSDSLLMLTAVGSELSRCWGDRRGRWGDGWLLGGWCVITDRRGYDLRGAEPAGANREHDALTIDRISIMFIGRNHYIYIYAFSRRFYPKRLTIAFRLYIFISTCVPWESNPQPFAQLTQCSTTEPLMNQ